MGANERAYIGWITGVSLGLPHEVIIGALVLARAHFLQRRTRFGRYSAAIGAGEAGGLCLGRQGRPAENHRLHALGSLRRRSPA